MRRQERGEEHAPEGLPARGAQTCSRFFRFSVDFFDRRLQRSDDKGQANEDQRQRYTDFSVSNRKRRAGENLFSLVDKAGQTGRGEKRAERMEKARNAPVFSEASSKPSGIRIDSRQRNAGHGSWQRKRQVDHSVDESSPYETVPNERPCDDEPENRVDARGDKGRPKCQIERAFHDQIRHNLLHFGKRHA